MMALSSKNSLSDQAGHSTVLFTPKEEIAMAQTYDHSIDSVICHEVTSLVSCTLDELIQRVPAYSWAQVFAAVDRLSRQGTLTLNRASRFGYVLSVSSVLPLPRLHKTGVG
jgi:hypothetical protein